MNELKLYIWSEFCPDYTDGLAFAIAETETEARESVTKVRGRRVWDWGPVEVRAISKLAYSVEGGS